MISIRELPKFDEIILNNKNLEIRVLSYGAIIKTIKFYGRDVVVGYQNNLNYLDDTNYLGAVVGRYANRIENAEISVDGIAYNLTPNDGSNHNHGGFNAFNSRIWDYKIIDNDTIRMHLYSVDNENGYPGNLDAFVYYRLKDNKLTVTFTAVSDKKTIYGPTSHIYFNIDNEDEVKDTKLMINASKYLKTNDELIPTGIMDCVDDYDFTSIRSIKNNYDKTFILNDNNAAVLKKNDIQINIKTDYPAMQLYVGEKVNGLIDGIALEPEFYPNSPNVDEFPSPYLEAGEFLLIGKD